MISQNKTKVKLWFSDVNAIFILHLILVGLVVTGILAREWVGVWTVVLAGYVLWARVEDSTVFFVRSIPFFVAIPLTAGFDSLNIWRILSGLIFLKWFLLKIKHKITTLHPRQIFQINTIVSGWNISFFRKHKVATALYALLLIAVLSAIQAPSQTLAIKRILYFINLSLMGAVIYDFSRKNSDFSHRLIKNIAIPTIVVAVIGIVQQATTYFMDIFQFVDFWGGVVQRNMYGNAWAEIATKANTWFAYYGNQLSLRIFSIFPDTHSYPIFLLLGLPAVMVIALQKIFQNQGCQNQGRTLRSDLDGAPNNKENWTSYEARPRTRPGLVGLARTRASWLVIFIPVIFLAIILTGTRGIWAAGVASALWAIFLILRHRKSQSCDLRCRKIFQYVASYLGVFFLLFGLAYYILATDQFQMQKGDAALAAKRARSIFDIAETSNARRIEIWKDSLRSIIKHPLLGVGIGNFPVVVGEDLARAKAGSSAHNLYLHIASELGLPALILALWFLWLLLKKVYLNFLRTYDPTHLRTIYFTSLLISLPWVLIYSLTDVAIFDERAFLLFVVTVALVLRTNLDIEKGIKKMAGSHSGAG